MTRALAEVLLELNDVRRDWDECAKNAEIARLDGDEASHERHGDRMGECDDKLDDLRLEFRSVFKERTGVNWSSVESTLMTGAL